jgi:hypothetical protein
MCPTAQSASYLNIAAARTDWAIQNLIPIWRFGWRKDYTAAWCVYHPGYL